VKSVLSIMLALVLVISMLAFGCNGNGPDVRLPDAPIPNVFVVTQDDTFSVDQHGGAGFESYMNVSASPLADYYRMAYTVEESGLELDRDDRGIEFHHEIKTPGQAKFRDDFREQLQEIYIASTGISLDQPKVGVISMSPGFEVLTEAQVGNLFEFDAHRGLWTAHIRPPCPAATDAEILMTQLMFKKLMLRSIKGDQQISWTKTISFALPEGAQLVNEADIVHRDRNWALSFGGATTRTLHAEVDVVDGVTLVRLVETTVVCQAAISTDPEDLLKAYLGYEGNYLVKPTYGTFVIEYQMPGSTAFFGSASHNPTVTLSSGGSSGWRWSWSKKWTWKPTNWTIDEREKETIGVVEVKSHLYVGPGVDVKPFIGVSWSGFKLETWGLWVDIEPWAVAKMGWECNAELKRTWVWDAFKADDVLTYSGTFMVWLIPVRWRVYVSVYAGVKIDLEAELSTEAEYSARAKVRVGYRWDDTVGGQRLTTFDLSYTCQHPTPALTGTGELTPYATLRGGLRLYEVAGVFLDCSGKGVLNAKLHADLKDEKGNFLAEWKLSTRLKVDIGVGVGIQDLLDIVGLDLNDLLGMLGGPSVPSHGEWKWEIYKHDWEMASGVVAVDMCTLTVEKEGRGTTDPAHSRRTLKGSTVTVEATPRRGWVFTGWSGHKSNAEQIQVVMDADKTITANFAVDKKLYGGGDGSMKSPFQIKNWEHLDNIRWHPNLHFELMNDLNSKTEGYEALAGPGANHGVGWIPICGPEGGAGEAEGWGLFGVHYKLQEGPFIGTFNGNGRTISDLVIDIQGWYPSLFGFVGPWREDSDTVIRDVILRDVSMRGYGTGGALASHVGPSAIVTGCHVVGGSIKVDSWTLGGLVGLNRGTVVASSAGAGLTLTGVRSVGGLVGRNEGLVSKSRSGAVVAPDCRVVGGLVGHNTGIITSSSATGDVSGTNRIGGLIGWNQGAVEYAHAEGNVEGDQEVGGLVGRNDYCGVVAYSYALGEVLGEPFVVVGEYFVGGLVGLNIGTVRRSHSGGQVIGTDDVGGLVGCNMNTVEESYASAGVEATNSSGGAGGLVGRNHYGTVSDSYATGEVVGDSSVGGLVGINHGGTVRFCYSIGSVTGTYPLATGGLVGMNTCVVSDSFWDTKTSNRPDSSGGTGKTTDEMQDITTFTDTATVGLDEPWDMVAVTGPDRRNLHHIWNIVDKATYPFLSWEPVLVP